MHLKYIPSVQSNRKDMLTTTCSQTPCSILDSPDHTNPTVQLFNCTQKCMFFTQSTLQPHSYNQMLTNPMFNSGQPRPYKPYSSVVQLHVEMHVFYTIHITTTCLQTLCSILDSPDLTNPTVSCSSARKMHGFSTAQALQTLQSVVQVQVKMHEFQTAQNSPKQAKAAQSSPEQPKTVQNKPE